MSFNFAVNTPVHLKKKATLDFGDISFTVKSHYIFLSLLLIAETEERLTHTHGTIIFNIQESKKVEKIIMH